MLLQKAHQERFGHIEDAISLVKEGWAVLEQCHSGIAINKRIKDALTECWQRSYNFNDSAYSIKITTQDVTRMFEQFLIELNPSISYYHKQAAISAMHAELYQWAAEMQNEYRATIERTQKLILRNLAPYFPAGFVKDLETDTDHFFKDGFRFLIFVILKKYNKSFSKEDELFINEKIGMFLMETGRTYPYISSTQFEAWVFATLHDLMFAECQVCMDRKADQYVPCCKTRNICKQCYAKLYQCPFCRAIKM
jgi:hypothetical protein